MSWFALYIYYYNINVYALVGLLGAAEMSIDGLAYSLDSSHLVVSYSSSSRPSWGVILSFASVGLDHSECLLSMASIELRSLGRRLAFSSVVLWAKHIESETDGVCRTYLWSRPPTLSLHLAVKVSSLVISLTTKCNFVDYFFGRSLISSCLMMIFFRLLLLLTRVRFLALRFGSSKMRSDLSTHCSY